VIKIVNGCGSGEGGRKEGSVGLVWFGLERGRKLRFWEEGLKRRGRAVVVVVVVVNRMEK
jgi:nicotinamide mononucleotide (NMN) deamidase PncC